MNGNVWASPLGDVLITRGGDVFTAAGATRNEDMIYLRGTHPQLHRMRSLSTRQRNVIVHRRSR